MGFAERYNATPFDPNNRGDALSERARVVLVDAFLEALSEVDAKNGEDMQSIASGLLVGLICVMMAQMKTSDESHAALRAGLIELIPWAVDLVRTIDDLPPLPEC